MTYIENQPKYAAVQWTGNAADLAAFLAIYDPNRRGAAGNPDNSWNYVVNADGTLQIPGAMSPTRNLPVGEWMVAGPYWQTPEPGGIVDYVFGPPMASSDMFGFTDAEFQARWAATT